MNYQDLLEKIVKADDRVVVMTAENRAAIRGLPDKIGANFIDTGITEQAMVGMAAGLALRGRIPVTHALACFLTMRAYEFIRTDAGIANLPVKLIGFIPGLLSEANGPTHQAIEDISIMAGIPNMEVYCPSDEADLLMSLPTILERPHPAYIRYIGGPSVTATHQAFQPGVAEILSEGHQVNILTYGLMTGEALKAAAMLEEKGVSTGVIHMRSLKPLDEETVLQFAGKSSLLVTLEDHFLRGGLYSIVCEVLARNKTIANILPIAFEENWFRPGLLAEVMKYEKFDAASIADRIITALESAN